MNIIKSKKIIWPIVIMYLLQCYLLSDQLFFALVVITFIYTFLKSDFKLDKLKIPGIKMYLVYLAFITIIGLIRYPFRYVARDIFYQFNNLVIIYIGYHLFKKNKSFEKIYTTIFFMLGLVSTITVVLGIVNTISSGLSFAIFRTSFSLGIKSLECFVPIFFMWIFIYKKTILSKKLDRIIMFIWLIQIVCNLSRTTLLSIIVSYIIIILLLQFNNKISLKKIGISIGLVLVIVMAFWSIMNILPGNIINQFSNKLSRSFTEINSKETFNNLAEANLNWRGYEISEAINLWRESSLFVKIFGAGNGALITIRYIPDQWKDIIQTLNGITGVTVLHNTYYTFLIKGGVFLVALFGIMFILNIKKGIVYFKNAELEQEVLFGVTLIILCCTMLIDAYVTRGMMQNDAQFAWALLFGWVNARLCIKYKDE